MKMQHKNQGYTINVTSRHNKPIVTKRGFIQIEKGQYKSCSTIQEDVLLEKFKEVKHESKM